MANPCFFNNNLLLPAGLSVRLKQSLYVSKLIIRCLSVGLFIAFLSTQAHAATFTLPENGDNVVGRIEVITLQNPDTTLLDIARHFDISREEIKRANPDVSLWVPNIGSTILIPKQFILPDTPQEGIVINIAQRRLFYYPPANKDDPARVITYPVSIAREGWHTPTGLTSIVAKHRDPSWFVPKSIKEEHFISGEEDFPSYFPPGPDNPMGMLAMQTGFRGIYIHGTNKPWGIGLRVSHGCIHLYPEDAAEIFSMIEVGTSVRVINEPILIGSLGANIYLSSYSQVDNSEIGYSSASLASSIVFNYVSNHQFDIQYIDWDRMQKVAAAQQNLPIPITMWSSNLEDILSGVIPEPYTYGPYGIEANSAAPPESRN